MNENYYNCEDKIDIGKYNEFCFLIDKNNKNENDVIKIKIEYINENQILYTHTDQIFLEKSNLFFNYKLKKNSKEILELNKIEKIIIRFYEKDNINYTFKLNYNIDNEEHYNINYSDMYTDLNNYKKKEEILDFAKTYNYTIIQPGELFCYNVPLEKTNNCDYLSMELEKIIIYINNHFYNNISSINDEYNNNTITLTIKTKDLEKKNINNDNYEKIYIGIYDEFSFLIEKNKTTDKVMVKIEYINENKILYTYINQLFITRSDLESNYTLKKDCKEILKLNNIDKIIIRFYENNSIDYTLKLNYNIDCDDHYDGNYTKRNTNTKNIINKEKIQKNIKNDNFKYIENNLETINPYDYYKYKYNYYESLESKIKKYIIDNFHNKFNLNVDYYDNIIIININKKNTSIKINNNKKTYFSTFFTYIKNIFSYQKLKNI